MHTHIDKSPNRRFDRITVTLTLILFASSVDVAAGQQAWTPPAEGFPQTPAELSAFEVQTGHPEMWDYLEALRGASTEMRLGSYGETWEGRDIPYAVYSRPLVSEPWEAWALDRPIVLLAANVHGGERTFREGLLILMRDLATPGTQANALLDEVTVIVAPQINPDGYEASERGTRGNAWGIDLNRDYVKLEQPALAHYVSDLMGAWRPHMFVDSHNGGSRPYNLCYQCPSHFDPAQELTLVCDQEIFPSIDAKLGEEGLRSWYYSGGNEEQWRVGGFQARIGRNYGGFTNAIGILFEAPGQDPETGARAGYLGNLAVVEYAALNAEKVMKLVDDARMETVALGAEPRGEIAVQMEYAAEDYLVDYTVITGGGRFAAPDTPVDTVDVMGGKLMKKPVATKTRPRPYAYILQPRSVKAVEMLKRHNVKIETLLKEVELDVQVYQINNEVKYAHEYDHPASASVEVIDTISKKVTFPKGSFIIQTGQALGRVVTHMLEPETNDNVVKWNTMDFALPRRIDPARQRAMAQRAREQGREPREPQPVEFPIFKLMRPQALPTSVIN